MVKRGCWRCLEPVKNLVLKAANSTRVAPCSCSQSLGTAAGSSCAPRTKSASAPETDLGFGVAGDFSGAHLPAGRIASARRVSGSSNRSARGLAEFSLTAPIEPNGPKGQGDGQADLFLRPVRLLGGPQARVLAADSPRLRLVSRSSCLFPNTKSIRVAAGPCWQALFTAGAFFGTSHPVRSVARKDLGF